MTTSATAAEINAAYDLFKDGRHSESQAVFEDLHSRDPNNANVINGLALAYQSNERYADAIELFRKLLPAANEHAATLHNLSLCYIRLGDDGAAETFAENAAQLDSDNPQFLKLLGLIKVSVKEA